MNGISGINALLIHGILFPVITAIPLLVTAVVYRVAHREAVPGRSLSFHPTAMRPLCVATALVWVAFALWCIVDGRSLAAGERGALPGITEIVAFALLFGRFCLPLLARIEADARRSVQVSLDQQGNLPRAASLTPRRLSNYLSARIRAVPWLVYAFSLALLANQIAFANEGVRLFLPLGFAGVAGVFLFLFDAWIREEALDGDPYGASVSAESRDTMRRARVRQLFAVQTVLGSTFSVLALVAVGIPWQSPGGQVAGAIVAAIGAIVGTLGCAFALSSSVQDRVLRLAARRTLT